MEKNKVIKNAAMVAIVGNAILAVLKIYMGAASQSGALVGDGIDTSADVLISVMTLLVARIISKPADAEHPWGHGRAETVMTAFLSFVLFFTGAQLFTNAVSNIFGDEPFAPPTLGAAVVTVISIVGKILLAWFQYGMGKRAGSAMIMANAKNMAGDVVISAGVLIGLVISKLTGSGGADTVIAGLIGIWIIKTAAGIFLTANLELMDGNKNTEPYRVIVDAVNAVDGAGNPHRARMRLVGGFWDIDFDIDVDPECSVARAHEIASLVEREIKARLENVYDIMIHIEPQGFDDDSEETFGLSEKMMRGE